MGKIKDRTIDQENTYETVFINHSDAAREWMTKISEIHQIHSDEDIAKIYRWRNEAMHGDMTTNTDDAIDALEKAAIEAYTAFYDQQQSLEKRTGHAPSAPNAKAYVGLTSSMIEPPSWAETSLIFLLPRDQREAVMGDLEEDYIQNIVPKLQPTLAKTWCCWQALRTALQYNGLTVLITKLIEIWKKSNGS